MATAAEDLNDGKDVVDPNAADPDAAAEGGEDQGNGEDSPYAPLAKDLGWTPKDQFAGPPEQWKDAETFIRDGRDIQREASREVKSLRSQLDTIAKTTGSIVEQQVKERVDQLTQQFTKAVEDGDTQGAFKISREIDQARSTTAPTAASGPSPEAQAFAERNAAWFKKPGHEYATARAIAICNELNAAGYTDHGEQLRIAEQKIRKEMPELFGQRANGKPAAHVNAPGNRGAGPSNRQKGFADMPPEAQKIAADMESRGLIKKEDYVKNYFANLQAKG